MQDIIEADTRRARYGVQETNGIELADYSHTAVDFDYYGGHTPLSDPALVSIDRLRLLTEPGYPYYDVSYCYGTLRDGRHVRVDIGDSHLPRRGTKRRLVELASEAGRYAKGLGLLDENRWSILR